MYIRTYVYVYECVNGSATGPTGCKEELAQQGKAANVDNKSWMHDLH